MKCSQIPLHQVTYAAAIVEVAMSNMTVWEMHLKENTLYDLDLGCQGHTKSSLVHFSSLLFVTYAAAKV